MDKKELTLNEVVNMTYEQIHAHDGCDLFYDWFCKETSLPCKAKSLLSKVRGLVKTGTTKFDPAKTYVFFKNNCPCYGDGRLYDDFRICDMESGNVLYTITPRDPYGNVALAFEGHGFEADTKELIFDSYTSLKAWFKDDSKIAVRTDGKNEVLYRAA